MTRLIFWVSLPFVLEKLYSYNVAYSSFMMVPLLCSFLFVILVVDMLGSRFSFSVLPTFFCPETFDVCSVFDVNEPDELWLSFELLPMCSLFAHSAGNVDSNSSLDVFDRRVFDTFELLFVKHICRFKVKYFERRHLAFANVNF